MSVTKDAQGQPTGTATLTWTATGLPPGLTIGASTGLITGTAPTTAGMYASVKVTVTDAVKATNSVTFTWVIGAPPVVSALATPGTRAHTLGVALPTGVTHTATGGKTPYKNWSAGSAIRVVEQ
jgi:hypothetical protein